jgi:protein arginine N-methyltransferase 2
VLRAEDNTAAGSTDEFLRSKLIYRTDSNGQDIVVVNAGSEEVGVMMGWEKPISEFTKYKSLEPTTLTLFLK